MERVRVGEDETGLAGDAEIKRSGEDERTRTRDPESCLKGELESNRSGEDESCLVGEADKSRSGDGESSLSGEDESIRVGDEDKMRGGEFKMNLLRSQDLAAFSQEKEAAITLTLELVDESEEYAEVILPPNIIEDDKRIVKTVKMNCLPITISPSQKNSCSYFNII